MCLNAELKSFAVDYVQCVYYRFGETTQLPDNCQEIEAVPFTQGLFAVDIDSTNAEQLYL